MCVKYKHTWKLHQTPRSQKLVCRGHFHECSETTRPRLSIHARGVRSSGEKIADEACARVSTTEHRRWILGAKNAVYPGVPAVFPLLSPGSESQGMNDQPSRRPLHHAQHRLPVRVVGDHICTTSFKRSSSWPKLQPGEKELRGQSNHEAHWLPRTA
ncbi:hypothetical protein VTG60DRAFT_5999 [Thermothelomyces hinnuleus]